jgi:glyoxylase-like metal-dependent hydrolase (beta-lactamase superfamily II)
MEQLTANVFIETGLKGANHGVVTTSDGLVLIDTPHKPSDAVRLKGEIERLGCLRYIINTEPHGDHWTGNAFFDVPVVAHEGVRSRILGTDLAAHVARVASFGPDEPKFLENYKANAPVITFQTEMTLHVGNHTFHMIHMPGHTPYQAAVVVEEEGVVFTSDNIFCKVQTWLQEANPDHWLKALASLRALREETFVPGHGPVMHDKTYLFLVRDLLQSTVEQLNAQLKRTGPAMFHTLDEVQSAVDLSSFRERFAGTDQDKAADFDYMASKLVKIAFQEASSRW